MKKILNIFIVSFLLSGSLAANPQTFLNKAINNKVVIEVCAIIAALELVWRILPEIDISIGDDESSTPDLSEYGVQNPLSTL